MSKHTEAPWLRFSDSKSVYARGSQEIVADVRNERDLAVIAAAPNMLAALKLIIAATREGSLDEERKAELNAGFRAARAAIAKAEGKP